MDIEAEIENMIGIQPANKGADMRKIHETILSAWPTCRLWYDNGKDSNGRTITNPTIGYGLFTIKYANGKTKDFFRIGMSATKTGISVYILGIKDKTYLSKTYADKIGKANVTGYCISFITLADIKAEILEAAIRYGLEYTND